MKGVAHASRVLMRLRTHNRVQATAFRSPPMSTLSRNASGPVSRSTPPYVQRTSTNRLFYESWPSLNQESTCCGKFSFSTSTAEARRKGFAVRQKRQKDKPPISRSRPKDSPKNQKTSTATSLMENWENTPGITSAPLRKARAIPSSGRQHHNVENDMKQARFKEFQQAFINTLSDYRNVWYPLSLRTSRKFDVPQTWEQAVKFQHPPLSAVTWKMVLESEELFRGLCTIHHDLFVASAYLAESSTQTSLDSPPDDDWSTEMSLAAAPQDLMCALLPFWERMRRERRLIVENCRPQDDNLDAQNESDANQSGGWMNWLVSAVGGKTSPPKEISITAHEDVAFGPNLYHYTKLVGRIFFQAEPQNHTPSDEDPHERSDELAPLSHVSRKQRAMMQERANKIQALVDQCSSEDSLSTKTIRLLVRAHAEVGTLEAAQQAERVYNKYEKHRKNLSWYVLDGYFKVVNDQIQTMDENQKGGAVHKGKISLPTKIAVKRICELASATHSSSPVAFQSCVGLAFQALAVTAPYADGIAGYYDRVHSLGVLKFGAKAWEAIIQPKTDDSGTKTIHHDLRPKDHRIMNQLILIYSENEKFLDRALRILEVAFEKYPTQVLKESFKRETFHCLLHGLITRQKERMRKESSQDDDFDRGVLSDGRVNPELHTAFGLVDKMMLQNVWFPSSQTFFHLFRLSTHSGSESDHVRTRLEACRSLDDAPPCKHDADSSILSSSYPLSPVKAAKFALNGWMATAEKNGGEVPQGEPDPCDRAWNILSSLRIASSPLFLPAETVSDIYDLGSAPDISTYILVLRICGRVRSKKSKEVTMKVLDIIEQEGNILEGSICKTLLRAINNSSEMEHRVIMTKRVYELVAKDEEVLTRSTQRTFESQVGYFRRQHPSLYKKHLAHLFD
jgi:hypothetical protein